MQTLSFTIVGCPRTKKNNMQIIKLGKRYSLIPSKYYKAYEKEALAQISDALKQDISTPVNVKCVYYMQTHRRVDLCNLLECTCDVLTKAGTLHDDCSSIVASHDGSRVMFDKDFPRVEVEIRCLDLSE